MQERQWYCKVHQQAYFEQRASRVGQAFERAVFSAIYSDLRSRGIMFYHETPNYKDATLGLAPQQLRRVEGRLFASDLLNPKSGIGHSLREFLLRSGRPELAWDATVGSKYGAKVTKYPDEVTSLVIANLRGAGGQRTLDPHVRVLGAEEFAGPNWLNAGPTTCERVREAVRTAQEALRHGLESPEYHALRVAAGREWAEVRGDVAARASRAQYIERVQGEVQEGRRPEVSPPEHRARHQEIFTPRQGPSDDAVQHRLDAIIASGKLAEHPHEVPPETPAANSREQPTEEAVLPFPKLPPEVPREVPVPTASKLPPEVPREVKVTSTPKSPSHEEKPQPARVLPKENTPKTIEPSLADLFAVQDKESNTSLLELTLEERRRRGFGVLPTNWLDCEAPRIPQLSSMIPHEPSKVWDFRYEEDRRKRSRRVDEHSLHETKKEEIQRKEAKSQEQNRKTKESAETKQTYEYKKKCEIKPPSTNPEAHHHEGSRRHSPH
jgi:hypothetical protein